MYIYLLEWAIDFRIRYLGTGDLEYLFDIQTFSQTFAVTRNFLHEFSESFEVKTVGVKYI